MFRFPRLVASALAALTLATAVPAFAEGAEGVRQRPAGEARERKPLFSMGAKQFHTKLEANLQRHLERLGKRLEQHKVSAPKKREILSQEAEAAKAIRAAAARAEQDGTVTLEEAKRVREVVRAERQKVRELLPTRVKKAHKEHKEHGKK